MILDNENQRQLLLALINERYTFSGTKEEVKQIIKQLDDLEEAVKKAGIQKEKKEGKKEVSVVSVQKGEPKVVEPQLD